MQKHTKDTFPLKVMEFLSKAHFSLKPFYQDRWTLIERKANHTIYNLKWIHIRYLFLHFVFSSLIFCLFVCLHVSERKRENMRLVVVEMCSHLSFSLQMFNTTGTGPVARTLIQFFTWLIWPNHLSLHHSPLGSCY